jgi:Polyketide cyclase / dehydrase and lipid transport
MAEVTAAAEVPLGPEAATALWRDTRRWSGFVEGFQRVEDQSPDWPAEGGKVVWVSGEGGRGRVTEKVKANAAAEFRTQVFEERLVGMQSFVAAEHADGSRVELRLEYDLTSQSPLRGVTDLLFIRRALRDALGRTLRRFAVEAQDEAGLR